MKNPDAETRPWLTVIMPTHQGEDWLDLALKSLVAEEPRGIEVLVIDSSPTSATVDIARRYAERLDLRVIERPDLGMWHAKTNFGAEIALAPYLCWLHQDDLWLPGRVGAVRSWIEAGPEVCLHLAPSAIVDRLGRKLGTLRCPLPANRSFESRMLLERLIVQNFVTAPAPVFRRDAWLACGGLDETLWYTADWDMWLKLAAFGPVLYHDVVTTGFRIHGGSLTMTGSRDITDFNHQMRLVFDRHHGRLTDDAHKIERIASASIELNTALARVSLGDFRYIGAALFKILTLGPRGMSIYQRDSRIIDRVAPRIRTKLMGKF